MAAGHETGGSRLRYVTAVGYLIYIGLLPAGYYYNLTFVQLGLIDLGTRRVGMSDAQVSAVMAGFALAALIVAVMTGRIAPVNSTPVRPADRQREYATLPAFQNSPGSISSTLISR